MITPLQPEGRAGASPRTSSHWRKLFLDHLAASSNVTASAEEAGIRAAVAYAERRKNPDFARAWRAALCEGYAHLEMETLYRLRNGIVADSQGGKFDLATAVRLLAAHRDEVAKERAERSGEDVGQVLASIDAMIEGLRDDPKRPPKAADTSGGDGE